MYALADVCPGMSNIVCAPMDVFHTVFELQRANIQKNAEAQANAGAKLIAAPIAITNATLSGLDYVYKGASLLGHNISSISNLAAPAAIVGLPICAIGAAVETYYTYQGAKFLQIYTSGKSAAENAQKIFDDFLSVNSKDSKELEGLGGIEGEESRERAKTVLLEKKHSWLQARVSPWLATELKQITPGLIHEAKNGNVAAKNLINDLMTNVDIQAKKKLTIHIIGLIALVFIAAGLIAGLMTCAPVGLAIALGMIGFALSITKMLLTKGWLENRGWEFTPMKCVPEIFRKLLERIGFLGQKTESDLDFQKSYRSIPLTCNI